MRLIGAALVLGGALAFSAFSQAQTSDKATETVDKTVALPAGGTVRLHTFSGSVVITAAAGRNVVIHAVRRADRDVLDHVKLDVTTDGSVVSIDANKRDPNWTRRDNNVVETAFTITVPTDARIDANSFSSSVTVEHVEGDIHVKTFSGEIHADGVTAPLNAETFSGPIEIDAAAAGARPLVTAKTFSGPIKAQLSGKASGEVQFDSFSGRLDADIPLTLHSAGAKHVTADLPGGASGPTLEFHTFSGDVHITKAAS